MYTNAAPEVINFISEQKKNGDLLDIYSNEWLEKRYKGSKYIKNEINAFIKKEGIKFIGHMLIIHLADESEENLNKFISIYKPFENVLSAKNIFGYSTHNPDFIFVNLHTKQILAAGLGRKNRLFLVDVESEESIDYDSEGFKISASDIFTNKNKSYYEKFIALDCLDIVTEIISALEKLGVSLFSYASCRNKDEIEEILETSPNEDGYYTIDRSDVSKEELEDELDEIESSLNSIYEAIQDIQQYFPNAEV
jgi:hypothetical protein